MKKGEKRGEQSLKRNSFPFFFRELEQIITIILKTIE